MVPLTSRFPMITFNGTLYSSVSPTFVTVTSGAIEPALPLLGASMLSITKSWSALV